FGQRLTLTTLGHCERPPTRAPLAPLARPESVDVHNAQVSSDLAALGCALLLFCTVKLNQLSNGSPWRHLAHQKRPPTRISLAPLASPSSAGVLVSQVTPDLAVSICAPLTLFKYLTAVNALLLGPRSQEPRLLSLTTAKSRQTSPPWAVQCCLCINCAPPAAQGESGDSGSDNSENDSERLSPRAHSFSPLCSCCDSDTRLRRAAKVIKTLVLTKNSVPNFLGFLCTAHGGIVWHLLATLNFRCLGFCERNKPTYKHFFTQKYASKSTFDIDSAVNNDNKSSNNNISVAFHLQSSPATTTTSTFADTQQHLTLASPTAQQQQQ
ncbi:hypothetical protein TYRP_000721, partial [Tyrophagus putrescentiae]